MINTFSYNFEELPVSVAEIGKRMGFDEGAVPDPFPELINKALNEASNLCSINGGFKTFEAVNFNHRKKTMQISERVFSPGKVVFTQLKNATSAALFVCTAGREISAHSAKLAGNGDPLLSYIFDIIGSLTVEAAMDKIQNKLKWEMGKSGIAISDRYSPGYCDWDVAEQKILFGLLPHNFCGVTLSGSSLMTPIKSVSGVIGIGREVKQKGYQCAWCSDPNCIYRNRKKIS